MAEIATTKPASPTPGDSRPTPAPPPSPATAARPPPSSTAASRTSASPPRGYQWAFGALTASPGARAHYDRRRNTGDRHPAALRNLFNRLTGCLHHCLTTGQHYDEATAFPTPSQPAQDIAA